MSQFLPSQLESTLIHYVKQTYLPERYQKNRELAKLTKKDLEFFAPAIIDLSLAFTSERSELPKNYFSRKEFRSAYLLYFFMTNFAKTAHCLRQLRNFQLLPQSHKVRVLDVGSGPCTASLAVSFFFQEFFPETELEIIALEQSFDVARDGRNVFQLLAPKHHQLKIVEAAVNEKRFPKNVEGEFDLIIAANVLNELIVAQQAALSQQLLGRLNSNGRLMIIEPALQKSTRQLMELRDELLSKQLASVCAPCLHQQACPMRENNKRDWCHFYVEWDCPKLIRDFDELIGNKHDYLKMAYMIFSCHPEPKVKDPDDIRDSSRALRMTTARVVSAPLGSKGKTELLVCSSEGVLERLSELDRHREKKAQPFKGSMRGDIVALPSFEKKEPFNK